MLRLISLITDRRNVQVEDIERNIATTTGIVILGPEEANIDHIPEWQKEWIKNISYNNKIPIYIITCAHKKNPNFLSNDERWKYTHIIYWPLFWLSRTLCKLIHSSDFNKKITCDIYNDLPDTPDFNYTFICLNRNPKNHRYILMDKLAKYDLIEGNSVSFRLVNDSIIIKQLEHWNPTPLFLDQRDVENLEFDQHFLPKEYNVSFMQLVTESDDEIFLLSEKTAIPLFFCKPFLVAANEGFHNTLSEFGFQLYNEIFDYNFDFIPNQLERYDSLVKNIVKYNSYSKKELRKVYDSIKDKLIYNRNLAKKIACDINNFPTEWNHFSAETNNDIKMFINLNSNKI